MRKAVFVLFVLVSCNLLEPVNRKINLDENNDRGSLIKYNGYYVSNRIKNNGGKDYIKVFLFQKNGSIKVWDYFYPNNIIDKTLLVEDRYLKDWRFFVNDSTITLEYVFRTPGRTLAYYSGIFTDSCIVIKDGYVPVLNSDNFHGIDTIKYLGRN